MYVVSALTDIRVFYSYRHTCFMDLTFVYNGHGCYLSSRRGCLIYASPVKNTVHKLSNNNLLLNEFEFVRSDIRSK